MQHREGYFKGKKRFTLYHQQWLPDRNPVATLVVVHGLGEHSGYWTRIVDYFVPKGYAVSAFDSRGHGRSGGIRSHVERLSYCVDDLRSFLTVIRREQGCERVFPLGIGMGGTIATLFAVEHHIT